ncbi:MAG: hypothetical protein COZ34_00350 [Candidatus Pacebacteria bacterium CG_4_10_14_3_um_filter_34_15]|nr:hypothetical protein [Candidatus Paceibacterota bacterium]NCS86357.1 hypothetical protein [Candidatus Paceibacterota bacterium]OIO43545.1 MAG: hypothetical protein AUJ41_04890 [Candidatus Pacebacteria bacterium CG1_02_43_31]PIX82011.1 MAG: hypothetical protein COZ34_00350 [Candidatus Pacebacteria bacterium CG_4_10_14_3_um_filter_34_15]PJC43280.1 MAG: hypothetical protein CO039_04885 [Candidatus Pacebacteria bacterium CG_4_9_14_0_2_um_filter_34_50]
MNLRREKKREYIREVYLKSNLPDLPKVNPPPLSKDEYDAMKANINDFLSQPGMEMHASIVSAVMNSRNYQEFIETIAARGFIR